MAQTVVLTAQTAAGNSADIVVTTTPTTIALYSNELDGSMDHVKVKIEQKTPSSNVGQYQSFHDERSQNRERCPVFLYKDCRTYTIRSPGTYRAVKDTTLKLIGMYTEG